jgi:hypothetical protein
MKFNFDSKLHFSYFLVHIFIEERENDRILVIEKESID